MNNIITMVINILKKIAIICFIIQTLLYFVVKQKYAELERKNAKIENEINSIINENNLLKIKLTTIQNQNRIRKLATEYASDFKPFTPKQVIEKQNI